MYYYQVAILGHKSPLLSYSSIEELQVGECVSVFLRNRLVKAVIIRTEPKPSFECKNIQERLYLSYIPIQINMAYFIASYYLCTLGESYQLFTPTNAYPLPSKISYDCKLKNLSSAQEKVLQGILPLKHALLFGDTGSGKTEVYFHLIHHALKNHGQALFLMPEISLTPQMEKRLQSSFGNCFGVWHSKISQKRRKDILNKIQIGEIRIIAGARSALFLPLTRLSLIIVDEEHDDAYKSQNTPFYNAKDLALWLSSKSNIKTVLGSATPCVTLYHKLQSNLFRLKGGHFKTSSQEIEFIQGSDEPKEETLAQIQDTFKKKQQVIIFLPTRANYKYIICPNCAKPLECQECTLTLSYHEKEQKISCHHCNYTQPLPKHCPYCEGELILKRIGTMELAKRLEQLFPQIIIHRLDKDSASSLNKLNKILKDFSENKIQVLIGTQMISKGHDYPNVGLVVILGIDYVFKQTDYRSQERVMALLLQLCGRSGRQQKGKVIIQTGEAKFFSSYLRQYEKFLQDEITLRGQDYPPFAKLAMLHLSDKNRDRLKQSYQDVHDFLKQYESKTQQTFRILAGGVCDIERLAGKWRFYLLVSSPSVNTLHTTLTALLKYIQQHSNPYLQRILQIDIDPLSFT